MRIFLFIYLSSIHLANCQVKKCIPKRFGYNSVVCVCNSTYCDEVLPPSQLSVDEYVSYTSSQAGLRFQFESGKLIWTTSYHPFDVEIKINGNQTYQTIFGWGGAFTDATGINIKTLPETAQENLMRSYFGTDGLEYNLCRVPIGGTDASTRGYSYNDGDPDPNLLNFRLEPEDYLYKIPLIKWAKKLNQNLELFASAWTAPKWMKHNGLYTGPDVLRGEMYQTWVDYFVKFLRAYKNESIEFWGLTTGNEPSTGLLPTSINSVGWPPYQMGQFISEYFGPTMRNSEFSSIKLLTIDDQMFFFPLYIDALYQLYNDTDSYIDGFALHWYWNSIFPHTLLTETHRKYPKKFILATEACEGAILIQRKVQLGDWNRAQSYALDIIHDLKNWVIGWVDWNMALDVNGGPSYIKNYLDSPIIINSGAQEFYKQPMFYALGHFSKFVPRGSVRIDVEQSSDQLDLVAFIKPNEEKVVVILNRHFWERTIKVKHQSAILVRKIPERSLVTIVFR